VTFMQVLLAERYVLDIIRKQQGNAGFHVAPNDVYRTKDGWIMVQAMGQPMFKRWARLVGREDLLADPRCADDITRADHHEVITEAMNTWAAHLSTDEAIKQLEEARVPCGKVYNLSEVFDDPQVQARKLLKFIEYPGSAKPVPVPGTPVRLSETGGEVRHRAPMLSEHTDEILRGLGFSADEIAEFHKAGVV
jgi:crotonobetainyl-CoA:carnitine CoA-transferase CaiB-like acyl-CoA transferase